MERAGAGPGMTERPAGGRKIRHVTVPGWGGRDLGKTFKITEMAALQAERWGYRMFLAIKGTSGELPDDVGRYGMVGVAIRGLNILLASPVRYEDIEPLLDEMLMCITIVRDPRFPDIASAMIPGDVEEVKTLSWLRSEVLDLHTGFSFSDALLEWGERIQKATSPST